MCKHCSAKCYSFLAPREGDYEFRVSSTLNNHCLAANLWTFSPLILHMLALCLAFGWLCGCSSTVELLFLFAFLLSTASSMSSQSSSSSSRTLLWLLQKLLKLQPHFIIVKQAKAAGQLVPLVWPRVCSCLSFR